MSMYDHVKPRESSFALRSPASFWSRYFSRCLLTHLASLGFSSHLAGTLQWPCSCANALSASNCSCHPGRSAFASSTHSKPSLSSSSISYAESLFAALRARWSPTQWLSFRSSPSDVRGTLHVPCSILYALSISSFAFQLSAGSTSSGCVGTLRPALSRHGKPMESIFATRSARILPWLCCMRWLRTQYPSCVTSLSSSSVPSTGTLKLPCSSLYCRSCSNRSSQPTFTGGCFPASGVNPRAWSCAWRSGCSLPCFHAKRCTLIQLVSAGFSFALTMRWPWRALYCASCLRRSCHGVLGPAGALRSTRRNSKSMALSRSRCSAFIWFCL
mmetsp:Transcript_8643/g.30208  ORF Transcript_8643/g.30208 Transcript_8643/m.30208 type:complete len:329 (-) Transcript_8643:289-1275(-)